MIVKIHLHGLSRTLYTLFFLGAGRGIGSRTGLAGGLGSRAGIGGLGESSVESEIMNMNCICAYQVS